MGTQLPLPKRRHNPQFWAHVRCGQTVEWIKMILDLEVGLGPGDFVLDEDWRPISSLLQKGHSPQFSAHAYCGQTAGWIKMPLGKEVGLGPGDIVLHGAQLSPIKWGTAPIFGPRLLWPNGRPSQLLLSSCVHRCHIKIVYSIISMHALQTEHPCIYESAFS